MRRTGKQIPITHALLDQRAERSSGAGYEVQKWIEFCRALLATGGYTLEMYEARASYSKYIYVRRGRHTCKIRFSNHKPHIDKEEGRDCDFFVGVNHHTVTTWQDAIKFVDGYFREKGVPWHFGINDRPLPKLKEAAKD